MKLIDVRISQLDAVDLRGVPTVEQQTTYFNAPSFLPVDDGSAGILFLDEINAGDARTMAAAYQLILDRRLGDYVLPDAWRIGAAGNRVQDRATITAMPAPLRNRFLHLEYEVHLDDFCQWCYTNGIHSDIIGFVRQHPHLLNELDTDGARGKDNAGKLKDALGFATPRTYSYLNRLISSNLPAHIEYDMYASAVGESVGALFAGFRKHSRSMPNIDALLIDPKKANVPEEPSTLYATSSALAARATEDNFERITQYLDRIPTEFNVMCVKECLARTPSITSLNAFDAWANKHADVML
jgi:hypothetical protein